MNKVLWLWWILGFLVVVLVCGACAYFAVKRMVNHGDGSCTLAPPEMIAPLVSPTREALYGSTGQTPTEVIGPEAQELDAAQSDAGIGAGTGAAVASHHTPPDDLDVGDDGFDGGLGSLEKVEEGESSDDVEAQEEIALLTVSANE